MAKNRDRRGNILFYGDDGSLLAALLLCFWPFSTGALSPDSGGLNFFELLQQAPQVVLAKLQASQAPQGARPYFVHELEIRETWIEAEEFQKAEPSHP